MRYFFGRNLEIKLQVYKQTSWTNVVLQHIIYLVHFVLANLPPVK